MSKAPRSPTARRDWGSDEVGCSIMHVDMDAFFASCELARRPEWQGRPVIVGGRERGVVLAATYEARAFGIRSAMPMGQARLLCPRVMVIPPDHMLYRYVSRSVMNMLHEITPLVEQVSVDEAFLDVSGAHRRLGLATQMGMALRQRIKREHGVTASVGVARNKFVAKLASTHAKPDGLMLIPDRATVDFLHSLPVGALSGVGAKTERALASWGITTVAELAHMDSASLQAAVGRLSGARLHDLAWGRDRRPVVPEHRERSVGAESTFGTDQYDQGVVNQRVLELSDRVAVRLRHQVQMARTVSVKVRTSDFATFTRSRTLSGPTDTARDIYRVARELVSGVDLSGLAVRLVGVRGENLQRRDMAVQQPTFEEAVDPRSGAQRDAEIALDAVRKKFGETAIGLGAHHGNGRRHG